MAKSKEELQKIKDEYDALAEKLKELSEDEIAVVTGGLIPVILANPDEHNVMLGGTQERKDKELEGVPSITPVLKIAIQDE